MKTTNKISQFLCVVAVAVFSLPAMAAMPMGVNKDGTITNQYIVTLAKLPAGELLETLGVEAQAQKLLTAVGGGQLLNVYQFALRGFSARLTPAQADLLRSLPLVASVSPDRLVQAIATQSNPPSYGLDRVDQRDLPLGGSYLYPDQAGQGVHIYVIDTGLNPNHSDFTGRVGTSRNFVGSGGLLGGGTVNPDSWTDCQGHGTHVAGTAAGTVYGVAKKATVHAVRVLDCNGSGTGAAILAGMDWVLQNAQQPAVVNLSLGTLGGRSAEQETAVRNLVNANIAVAVAAGNDNTLACNTSPAAEPAVLTTAATQSNDARASYSNYGTCVDLFAPGTSIISASNTNNTGTKTLSGTSMASPHVAGALAIKRAQNPSLSAVSVQNAVMSDTTANKVSNPGAGSPNKLLYIPNSGGPVVDNPPVANFSFSCNGLVCNFDGSASSDDVGISAYSWNFGDGSTGNGASVSRSYATAGTYTVRLTVTDGVSQTGTMTRSVTVTAAPAVPCTGCTTYSGSLTQGGVAYHNSSSGFSFTGGTLRGYLRAPTGTDFDLVLERRSSGLLGLGTSWSAVATADGPSNNEDISYSAASGTYRWRVQAQTGAGSYTFYGQPR